MGASVSDVRKNKLPMYTASFSIAIVISLEAIVPTKTVNYSKFAKDTVISEEAIVHTIK